MSPRCRSALLLLSAESREQSMKRREAKLDRSRVPVRKSVTTREKRRDVSTNKDQAKPGGCAPGRIGGARDPAVRYVEHVRSVRDATDSAGIRMPFGETMIAIGQVDETLLMDAHDALFEPIRQLCAVLDRLATIGLEFDGVRSRGRDDGRDDDAASEPSKQSSPRR